MTFAKFRLARRPVETLMRSDDDEPDYDIPKEDRNRKRPPKQ
jgi:hypothetical protein